MWCWRKDFPGTGNMLYINLRVWTCRSRGYIWTFGKIIWNAPVSYVNRVNVKELLIEVEGPEVGRPRLPALLLYQPGCVSAWGGGVWWHHSWEFCHWSSSVLNIQLWKKDEWNIKFVSPGLCSQFWWIEARPLPGRGWRGRNQTSCFLPNTLKQRPTFHRNLKKPMLHILPGREQW